MLSPTVFWLYVQDFNSIVWLNRMPAQRRRASSQPHLFAEYSLSIHHMVHGIISTRFIGSFLFGLIFSIHYIRFPDCNIYDIFPHLCMQCKEKKMAALAFRMRERSLAVIYF